MGLAGYVLIGTLAAFGLLSGLWVLWGFFQPVCACGWLLHPGGPESIHAAQGYLWLRGMGLVRCPLIVADRDLSNAQRKWLREKGIEVCGVEELPRRLGIGAETN